MEDLIEKARNALVKWEWQEALPHLEQAKECKNSLEKHAWWLTDKAIKALNQEVD